MNDVLNRGASMFATKAAAKRMASKEMAMIFAELPGVHVIGESAPVFFIGVGS